ncbi:MAG: cytochrome C [Desulfuromonas sp.]|nr:MAG: cytochrome C [Desulfuromonas sp.]
MKRHSAAKNLLSILLLCSLVLFATSALAAKLSVDDCSKCHSQEPQQIADAGAAHKKEINCIDCHNGHRPVSQNNVPACAQCHEGSDHYTLANCLACHNPHQPLNVVLDGELKAECLTCHTEQNAQLVAAPSAHTEVSCNFCHADTHGNIPACTECHDVHSSDMTQNDCATCHAAHAPTLLEYPDTTQNIMCAACHDMAFSQLQASQTKHHDVACVMCHADKHKVVPQCSDCHGMPHAAGIHAKFPQCGECHNTAHDLNNLK